MAAKAADANKYQFLEYPKGVGTPRYPHYVIFFVNINALGEIAQNKSTVSYDLKPGVARSGAIATGTGAIQKVPVLNKMIKSPSKRFGTAIALHMPGRIANTSSMNYEESEVTLLGKTILGVAQNTRTDNALGGVASGAEITGRATAGGALSGGVSGDMGAMMGAITGKIDNPRAETMFKSTGFRTHEFHYTFYPTSKEESDMVVNIIKMFRYHMHPELQSSSVATGSAPNPSFLVIPDEFDIEFHYVDSDGNDKQNTSLNKITTSVLTSLEVDYTNQGGFTAFAGTGNPTQVTLSMSFKEVEPINRKYIEEGY